jgi:DNA modification methylase
MTEQLINVRQKLTEAIPNRWYATHHFDRYPAKMIPQLARFVIDNYTKKGNIILDPFCGCGTSLIESRIAQRKSVGIEINPYAAILAIAKSHLYSRIILEQEVNNVLNSAQSIKNNIIYKKTWINYWFNTKTLKELYALSYAINKLRNKLSAPYICALQAILAVTVRLSSKADPRSPKPFISKKSRRERINTYFNAFEIFSKEAIRFINLTTEFRDYVRDGRSSRVRVFCADARNLSKMTGLGSFDAVISSPPYLSAQDYYRSSKLELSILGFGKRIKTQKFVSSIIGSGRGNLLESYPETSISKLRKVRILLEKDRKAAFCISKYIEDMRKVIIGIKTRLKTNGYCCLIVGDSIIRGIKIPTHKWICDILNENGFTKIDHFIDIVKSCRVPPQRMGHESVIKKEHILIYKNSGCRS